MIRFLLRRLAFNLLVLLGVLFVVHGLLLLTGDPAAAYLPLDAKQEDIVALRRPPWTRRPVPDPVREVRGKGHPR